MKRITFISVLALLSSLASCTMFDDRARGIADAKKSLRNGELVQTVPMGRYADGHGEYMRILRDEHGIKQEGFLGESKEYVEGFDAIMEPEIDRRFDREFFDRIWVQAREQHENKSK